MNNREHYLKIGEVAKLNHISTATLRYYAEIGLFSPDYISESGYRYYSVTQLVDLELIMWLRTNGASLQDIREILENKSIDQVVGIFKAEIVDLQKQIQLMKMKLRATRYYLSHYQACCELALEECSIMEFDTRYAVYAGCHIDSSDRNSYQIALNKIRRRVDHPDTFLNSYIGGAFPWNEKKGLFSPNFHPASTNIYNSNTPNSKRIDAGFYAVMLICGFYDDAYERIPKLVHYIDKMNYRIDGDCFVWKIWEKGPVPQKQGELLELQIPIKRK